MTAPLAVRWTNPRLTPSSANSWGYAETNRRLREAVLATGLLTLRNDAPLAFHISSPVEYRPYPDARWNVLLTMWESPDLPEDKRPFLHTADCLIVPSRFARELFAPHVRVPLWLARFAANFTPLYYRLTRTKPRFTSYALHTLCSQ